MTSNRRSFLKIFGLTIPAFHFNWKVANTTVIKPIVVSTWDSGTISNKAAWAILANNGKALDAVEQAAIAIEDHLSCCVGLGGNPDREGKVTLDACIMDDLSRCGSVAFLERIKHPISVARKIMEETPHVFLAGEGAQQFALENGFPLEPDKLSDPAQREYVNWLKTSEYKPIINIEHQQSGGSKTSPNIPPPAKLKDGSTNHDTMGTLAMDINGNLSGMCTTSGMAFKMRGRVGDSPIIGAGLFVDNEVGAATSSGVGEEVIRICGTHLVVEFMRNGFSPYEACKKAVERIVRRDTMKAKELQVGFLAINKQGEVGAFAIQPGFSYTLTTDQVNHQVVSSESYFKQ